MENEEAKTDVDEKQQTEKKRKAESEPNQQPPTKKERREPIPSGAATDSQGTGAQAEAFLETELDAAQLVGPAENGEAQAQYLLARCYAKGSGGVSRLFGKASRWYTAAAQQEHPKAQYKLGRCLSKGHGMGNPSEALQWYLKAAHHQHLKAQFRVALAYQSAVAPDHQEAVRWYRTAAERGFPGAQNNLGMCLARGDGVAKDREEAFKWFQAAAKQGHASAQYYLAYCYEEGVAVDTQWKEAVRWYRAAMEQGNVKAKYKLAIFLFKGIGMKGDPEQALHQLQELADGGCSLAMYKLARLMEQLGWHLNDDDVLMVAAKWYFLVWDDSCAAVMERLHRVFGSACSSFGWRAFYWYLKATKAGDASAQFNLALAFSKGKASNHKEAGKWFLAAAKQHHAHAQYFTARRLAAKGKKEEAMEWFLASARQGFPQAQFQVGLHLCEATSNKEDDEQGVEYCKQAAKARDPAALLWMAKHWRSKGQFGKARKCVDRLQEATPLAAEEVRLEGEMLLREMNKNKEGMPVRSLLEASKMAVAKQVMQTSERKMEKMKGGMPTELWQGVESLTARKQEEKEKENEEEEEEEEQEQEEEEEEEEQQEQENEEKLRCRILQKVYEEEQRVAVDRAKEEGEDEEYDGEDLYSGCWLSNLLQKEAVQQYYASLSTFHFRIDCDGCGAHPIQGVRYKCGHCPSFDLCSKCEAETTHDERHVFLKIKRPFHDEPPCAPLPDFYNV